MTIARRSDTRLATAFHGFTALLGVAALITQLVLVIRGVNVLVDETGKVAATPMRVVRFFSYFTIESNVLVIITAATLALRPDRDGPVWRVLRLDALIGISVTGLVYHFVLAADLDLHGITGLTDKIFHYGIPILAVIGWVFFGPRPRVDRVTQLWSGIFPALYIVWVTIFGAATGWYPYPFTDVNTLGYLQVIINGIAVIVLFLVISLLFRWLDRKLPARP